MQDFHYKQASLNNHNQLLSESFTGKPSTSYLLTKFITYQKFSPSFIAFSTSISTISEPSTYKQVMQHPGWCKALETELNALKQNQTWVITYLRPGKQPIDCKYVSKIKFNSDDSIERLKTRLVFNGFT